MSGDRQYTRAWIDKAGGVPQCNKCKIFFGGDYAVPVGYFDQPCQHNIMKMTTSEEETVQYEPCGGKWGVWPEEDPYLKYIDPKGDQRRIKFASFDKKGIALRTFLAPAGFSIDKFFDSQLNCFDRQYISRDPLLVVNLLSRKDGDIIFTFVGFYQ